MKTVSDFIESGILELYVLGETSPQDTAEVERMTCLYDEIAQEIESISVAFERYAEEHAVPPPVTAKAFIWATIDYTERIKNGEKPGVPLTLNAKSKISDYNEWLKRDDLQLTEPLEDIYALIIGHSPLATTAIVWIMDEAPPEHHSNEHEKFLIVEGTCDIIVEDDVYKMNPGDVFSVPLHLSHRIKVTSTIPCKVILQRIAA
jgi:mannose-6-phosphate isomerase-like protein (cupin superfamily)